MSTLYEWLADNDCALEGTIPAREGRTETHVVRPYQSKHFRGQRFAKLEDGSLVCVKDHPADWPYGQMPRFWRQQLWPHHFERWTEAEHDAGRRLDGQRIWTVWTWDEQQTVWAHRDAWTALADGEWPDPGAFNDYLDSLPPLPKLSRSALAGFPRRVTARREPLAVDTSESGAAWQTPAVVTPERLAEAERLVQELKAAHPEATARELAEMLRDRQKTGMEVLA